MKNLTKEVFEEFNFIPCLLKYFALSPENRVTAPSFGERSWITYYQDEDGQFHKIVDIKGFSEATDFKVDMDLKTLILLIRWLPELKPTAPETYGFKNMKEQVHMMSTAYVCWGEPV